MTPRAWSDGGGGELGDDRARERMVDTQLVARGVRDRRVLDAMRAVPRHIFVPSALRDHAYEDRPLDIGAGQTISQPYVVALMAELARIRPTDRVLEIGTGSGYQTAILCRLAAEVYSIEILEALAAAAAERLREIGCENLFTRVGDGHEGWPEAAPFDAIVVTAAPETVPDALVAQLAPGGRLIVPVGRLSEIQELVAISKDENGRLHRREAGAVRFVPLVRG